QPKPGLEETFMAPILARLFGDYPELDYVDDLRRQQLPANISVSEFFLKSGDYLKNDTAQQQYMATHYTHAARDMLLQGVNVVAQAVAVRERDGRREYSLSCNPDVTLDLLPLFDALGSRVFRILVVNRELPFMENDAIIDQARADAIVDCPEGTHTLFCAPNTEVGLADHAIGLHASSLVRDGGTLQIGIGSLGDAICHGLILRDRHNADYQALLAALGTQRRQDQLGPFRRGLYGCSEMFVNGFMKLMQAGIIRRAVYPHAGLQELLDSGRLGEAVSLDTLDALLAHGSLRRHVEAADLALLQRLGIVRDTVTLETGAPDGDQLLFAGHRVPARLDHDATRAALAADGLGQRLRGGHIMTGGFFLGPRDFYQALRDLDDDTRARINMTAIGFINQLYGQEALGRAQRRDASFINTCMMVTLLGAAVSDGLDSGRVVSGVGGQYNFVAMSHALPDAQSVLMLRASRRGGDGEVSSNIVWHYGHTTIPRHLRDIVITEYGIADLRGQTDSEVIKRLLAIADSRFQDDLLAQARANGKIDAGWRIPEHQRRNLPETLAERLRPFRARDLLPDFPFGTDLTPDELGIAKVLRRMQTLQHDKVALARALWQGRGREAPAGWLARMGLEHPQGVQQTLM
ncbi:acetyl-CoA hydrolase/transferase C-terminal domain-containing protein, partial [Amnimonas aquatica]